MICLGVVTKNLALSLLNYFSLTKKKAVKRRIIIASFFSIKRVACYGID